jgi:hypothetical protein
MKRWAAVALALVASTGIALGQARLGLFVVDATGKKVGYYSGGQVLSFIDGTLYSLPVGPAGFTPSGPMLMFYPTPDCSGTPYTEGSGVNGEFFIGTTYTSDGFLHWVSFQPPMMITLASNRSLNSDGSLGACGVSVGMLNAVPILTIPAPSFLPPFQIVDALPVSPAPAHATFNDVPTTDWAFQFIEALAKSGITSGCQTSPPLYCPDSQITRREMAVFLAVALGL